MTTPTTHDRILGGLLGLAAGDALGATLEFLDAKTIEARHGRHQDIIGGGMFNWRPGQGTDDTDLAIALARTYANGYTLTATAEAFYHWYQSGPRDIGGATARGLANYGRHRDPRDSGAGPGHAGNGSLMRALATGLVRRQPATRHREAAEISAITHDDPLCLDACIVYVDLVAALLDGHQPTDALALVADTTRAQHPDVLDQLHTAPNLAVDQLRTTGYVIDTLAVGIWALAQPATLEDTLIEIVNLGGDADTTGAVAGGLLGCRDGHHAIPARWRDVLEYADEIHHLADKLEHQRRATA